MIHFDTLIPGIERREKGEIATLLAILSLGLMLIVTFVATKLGTESTESRSNAAERNVQIQSGNCGYLPPTNGDDRSGVGCNLSTKPEVSFECASCITANQSGFREWWDSTGNAACNNIQIVSNWRQMEPDGKRNFYYGHTTEPGGPCNCFCASELANPDNDYGKVPTATTAPTSRPSIPTTTPTPFIFRPSPTLYQVPSPTNPPPPTSIVYPTAPPKIFEATPTVKKNPPPIPSSTPTPGAKMSDTIAKEIQKIKSTLADTSKKGVDLGKTTVEKGKNWLFDMFTNFFRETSF